MTYNPGQVRLDPLWLQQEFHRIAQALVQGTQSLGFTPSFSEPTKPFDGMIIYADGENWDPGYGEGFYMYKDGKWVKGFNGSQAAMHYFLSD